MPKTRDKSYWKSYRKVKTNVCRHINHVYNAEERGISSSSTATGNSVPLSSSFQHPVIHDHSDNETAYSSDSQETPAFHESDSDNNFSFLSDSSILSSNTDDENVDLNHGLPKWAAKYNITHTALRELLKILYPFHECLPKDPRTLMQTKNNIEISDIEGGHYCHLGVEHGIRNQLPRISVDKFTNRHETLEMQVNIDGVPLFKSSNTQFWPILGRIVHPFTHEPFIIGIFVGDKKPSNIQSFLQDFVNEMTTLEQRSIFATIADINFEFQISISCVICDTPARAFVKQVKGHSGYYGCDKCVTKGVWDGKLTFPEIDADLRTDVQFDEMTNAAHHTGHSPFSDLNIGMVTQFPIDFMHLVCLGVVKRLLTLWMKGPLQNGQRIAATAVRRISDSLLGMGKHLPREFLRKGRSLHEVDRWKATEFRQFLLYTGPLCLYEVLAPAVYRHFMLLFVGIYCLSSSLYYRDYSLYSDQILRLFVTDFARLYGSDMMVYNVHGLVHLAADVEKFGPLENYSAFVFESFLGRLKRLVRKPNYPLQQVIGRLSENCDFTETSNIPTSGVVKKEHRNGPLPPDKNNFLQFREVHLPIVFLSVFQGDNCVLIANKVALVRNILCEAVENDKFVVYEEFLHAENFFENPLQSKDLRIFLVSDMSGEFKCCKLSDISCKCVLLPFKDSFVSIPLLHTL